MVKVSVIMPFYNQSNYVDEAVQSILQQTYKDFELIIINDGSTESGVEDLLNQYQSNQVKVLHTANKGVAAARNLGISVSTGTYILPLDADDYIHPQMIESTVAILDKLPSIDIVRTGVQYVGTAQGTYFLPAYNRTQHLLQNLFFNTSLMRRNLLLQVGGYDENFVDGWEDWEMFLRYVNDEAQVYSLNKAYLYYRIKATSRNADLVHQKREKVEQQLYKKHIDLYLQYFSNPISLLSQQKDLQIEKAQFEAMKQEIYDSKSYRLGHLLLKPFNWLRKISSV
jgi:glycosyltransferase involved in cell wall biosynthesis